VAEDAHGLRVAGRLLPDVARGARGARRCWRRARWTGCPSATAPCAPKPLPGGGRKLIELELWEVSLVTFPMQAEARITRKSDILRDLGAMTAQLRAARAHVARL
jgi:uncharacterized protein